MGFQDKVHILDILAKCGPSSSDNQRHTFRIESGEYDQALFKRQYVSDTNAANVDTFGFEKIFLVLVSNVDVDQGVRVDWVDATTTDDQYDKVLPGEFTIIANPGIGTSVAPAVTVRAWGTAKTGYCEILVLGKKA